MCFSSILISTDLELVLTVTSIRAKVIVQIAQSYPGVMKSTPRFDAQATRDALLERGGPIDGGFIRFSYRPFDNRWLYWEADTELLDEEACRLHAAYISREYVAIRRKASTEGRGRTSDVFH